MSTYLYCRISKRTQNIERQKRNLKEAYPEGIIIEEKYTGTTIDRPEWTKLYLKAAPGDTIVFDSVSRMSRNAEEGIEIYEELYNKGVELVFLKEPQVNTRTYKDALNQQIEETGNEIADVYIEATNKVLVILAKNQYKLAFAQAEKEVLDLQQRTKEGMKTAKLNGHIPGPVPGETTWTTKKSIAAKEVIKKHAKDFGGSLTPKEVRALAGTAAGDNKPISKNSYYKYIREIKAAEAAAAKKEVEEIIAEAAAGDLPG